MRRVAGYLYIASFLEDSPFLAVVTFFVWLSLLHLLWDLGRPSAPKASSRMTTMRCPNTTFRIRVLPWAPSITEKALSRIILCGIAHPFTLCGCLLVTGKHPINFLQDGSLRPYSFSFQLDVNGQEQICNYCHWLY